MLSFSVFKTILFVFVRKKKRHVNLVENALKYKQFPLYNATTSMIDNLSMSLPIFFLTKFYSIEVVGLYSLVLRVAMTPLSFVSQAISDVLIIDVTEKIRRKLDASLFIIKISLVLLMVSIIPVIFLYFYGSDIFTSIFGDNWSKSGNILRILLPGILIKFVVSSVSCVFSSCGRNSYAASWKIFSFALTYLVLTVFSGSSSIDSLLNILVVSDIFLYVIYFILIIKAVKNPKFI